MSLLGLNDPFFKPLWIRVGVVAFCLGWALFEYVAGSTGWAVLFAGIGAVCIWSFFIDFRPKDEAGPDQTNSKE